MIPTLRRRLLDHYDRHGRDLPWRRDDDPYRIWVSEVMLQQTRVETVIPYYRRWMERFPTLSSLAAADREDVLREWKGLGYYSRARNLHRAAGIVAESHGGRLPTTTAELRKLPGVGEYTAGAVASIAFEIPEPAVDGNVRRVLSRIFDMVDPGAAEMKARAAELVDPERPGDFNQALMELGATICTPTSPACPDCPVESLCLARRRGTVDQRPPPRRKSRVSDLTVGVAVAVDDRGRTLLTRRPDDGLLGGMWEFPSVEADHGFDPSTPSPRLWGTLVSLGVGVASGSPRASGKRPSDGSNERAGRPDRPSRALERVTHRFSHLRATYHPHLFRDVDLRRVDEVDGVRVVSLEDLGDVPLPVAQQKIGRQVVEVVG